MNKRFELGNRYGDKNYLEQISDNKYILVFDESAEASSNYRVGLADEHQWEDHEYYFVDPSGGPFISVGASLFGGDEVTRIYLDDKKIVIETKNIDEESNTDINL